MLKPKKSKVAPTATKTKELTDKEKVLKIHKNAEIVKTKDGILFFVSVDKKPIAVGKNEPDVWKRALSSLI